MDKRINDVRLLQSGCIWTKRNSQLTTNKPRLVIVKLHLRDSLAPVSVDCRALNFSGHGFNLGKRTMTIKTLRAEWEPCT